MTMTLPMNPRFRSADFHEALMSKLSSLIHKFTNVSAFME